MIQLAYDNSESSETYVEEIDDYPFQIWHVNHPLSHEFLDNDLRTNEAIMEVMLIFDHPWEELQYCSYFLPKVDELDELPKILNSFKLAEWP